MRAATISGTVDLVEGIEDLGAIARQALDQRDAAYQEAAELREAMATCGAIASEALIENDRLLTRQRELLIAIARLAQETPFPDELKDWPTQRAKLVAEVGTLRARVAELETSSGGT